MKILIDNGNPDPENRAFEAYLDQLEQAITARGHQVTHLRLRDLDLRGCNGCFGCWVKTPGECVQPDDGPVLRQAIIASEFHLLAAPLAMGFPAALLKTGMDKSIPLIHPYFDVLQGEAHHRRRYARYPRVGLLVQAEPKTSARDLEIVDDIFARSALNMRSQLEFTQTIQQPPEALAGLICAPAGASRRPAQRLAALPGEIVPPPARLTIFNGSPRGRKSNTALLLEHLQRGFLRQPGASAESYYLNRLHDWDAEMAAFTRAECVLIGFPLYVDAMPGQVKGFIERLAAIASRPGNPPVGFLVQSGFPEAAHSRHVERYLQRLAEQLGAPYLGTLVKGGGEGIQTMPENMTAGVFGALEELGAGLAATGRFDADPLRRLAGIERFPSVLGPAFKLLSRTRLLSFYWDEQLKNNGAYERRFARPYSQ